MGIIIYIYSFVNKIKYVFVSWVDFFGFFFSLVVSLKDDILFFFWFEIGIFFIFFSLVCFGDVYRFVLFVDDSKWISSVKVEIFNLFRFDIRFGEDFFRVGGEWFLDVVCGLFKDMSVGGRMVGKSRFWWRKKKVWIRMMV